MMSNSTRKISHSILGRDVIKKALAAMTLPHPRVKMHAGKLEMTRRSRRAEGSCMRLWLQLSNW